MEDLIRTYTAKDGRKLYDPDDKNEWRADAGAIALRAFEANGYSPGSEDAETILGDMLCDLMHLCDREGFDFEALVAAASLNHAAETSKDGAYPMTEENRNDLFGSELAWDLGIKLQENVKSSWQQSLSLLRMVEKNTPEQCVSILAMAIIGMTPLVGIISKALECEDDMKLSFLETAIIIGLLTEDEEGLGSVYDRIILGQKLARAVRAKAKVERDPLYGQRMDSADMGEN